jgi:hypothetical protein
LEQVPVTADDQLGFPGQGCFQEFVVVWILLNDLQPLDWLGYDRKFSEVVENCGNPCLR